VLYRRKKYDEAGVEQMVRIKYDKGLEKEKIIYAVFSSEDSGKSLKLSCEDVYDENNSDIVIGQNLKILIKDTAYGGEELFVELDFETSKDVSKIIQRLLRQLIINNKKKKEIEIWQ
jgi:hypothetical protein